MDGKQFDSLLRQAVGDGSRRGVLRGALGGLIAATGGLAGLSILEEVAAKAGHRQGRRGRTHSQKKKKGSKKKPPVPVQQCTGTRPITCGPGCCGPQAPVCCSDPFLVDGVSCNLPTTTCCPDGFGCRAGFTCCPAEKGNAGGTCLPNGAGACCGPNSGGWCPTGDSCCPTATTNDDNFGCCLTGKACCNPGTPDACGAGVACPLTGCCP